MWIYTNFGFFSIIHFNTERPFLTVRARSRKDLVNFAKRALLNPSSIIHTPRSDYHFRMIVDRDTVQRVLINAIAELSYPNFKSEVLKKQGRSREAIYHDVWAATFQLNQSEARETESQKRSVPRRRSRLGT